MNTTRDFMRSLLKKQGFNPKIAKLKFNRRNSKLDDIITLSLPAGYSCPFAKDCRSCSIKNPRKRHDIGDKRKFIIKDGKDSKFRCYTAIDEVMRPSVRSARWWNFFTLQEATSKGVAETADLIDSSLPHVTVGVPTRAGVSGDFFNQVYFDAWLKVARRHPDRIFYAYTKSLPFWVKRLRTIPKNFKLTASYGGTHDWMIKHYGLRSVTVVKSPEEAANLGLPLDHDDSHAFGDGGDFALLVHGQQPVGTIWAKVWHALRRRGMAGYGRQKTGTKLAGVAK
jgi:hypothetical protein